MQNRETNPSSEQEQHSLKRYRTNPDFRTAHNDMPFHQSVYLKPRTGELGPRFCPHYCFSRRPMEMNQSAFSICSANASLNSMQWQPTTSYGPQHRCYVTKLEEENGLHSVCVGMNSSVHRPTPIYLAPVSLRVLQDEWAIEAQMTSSTIQDNKEVTKMRNVCLYRNKTSEKQQDGAHEIIKGQHFKEIGSSPLSAFYSKRKEAAQNSRNEERISHLENDEEDEEIPRDEPRQGRSSPGALDPDDTDHTNTSTNKSDLECFDAKLKIKEEPLQSPTNYEPNSADENPLPHQEEFSFYGTNYPLLWPQSVDGVLAYARNRSLLVQTTDHDSASVPNEFARRLDLTQDPSSSKFPSSGNESGVERNQQQKPKHICDECGRSFTRSSTLVTHKRIHSGDKPFSCEVCGRSFRQPGNLSRHRLTHTTTKPYVCPHCNKAFNRASNLHTHMRTHSDYKPYACDFCDQRFHQKVDMKIHRYTHTGEKPHKCSKCGRGFKQLTHLTYHMRTHSDVRMHHCEFCDKGFNQKGNLQAHRYRHTGERPFKCTVCGKGFTLASTRNTHLRTHADKKPFECQYCNKAFYQKNALKTHYIASHPYSGGVLIL